MSRHGERRAPRGRAVTEWERDAAPRRTTLGAASERPIRLPWEPEERPGGTSSGPAGQGSAEREEYDRFWGETEKRPRRRSEGGTRAQGSRGQGSRPRAPRAEPVREQPSRTRSGAGAGGGGGQAYRPQAPRPQAPRPQAPRPQAPRPQAPRPQVSSEQSPWESDPGFQERPRRSAASRPAPRSAARPAGGRGSRGQGADLRDPATRRPKGRDRKAFRDTASMPAAGRPRPMRQLPGAKFTDGANVVGVIVTAAVALAMMAVVEQSVVSGGATTLNSGASQKLGDPKPKTKPTARPSTRPTTGGGRAPAQTPSLVEQVRALTTSQLGPEARRSYGAAPTRQPVLGPTRFSADRTWALGTTAIPVPAGRSAMPEVAFFVARLTGGQWRPALAGTPQFTALLRLAPTAMIPAAEKRQLASYSGARSTAQTGLMLPWKAGDTWTMNAVARRSTQGTTRPLGMVSFEGGDGKVLAPGAGRVYHFCGTTPGRGMVMVVHDNGLATEFYQMKQVTKVSDGTAVKRGDVLGRIGTDVPCGGDAAGAQVMFGLRTGADEVPMDGASLGGWSFRERANPLVGWAERGLDQVLPGGGLRNFGAVKPVAPPVDVPGATASPAPVIPQPTNT